MNNSCRIINYNHLFSLLFFDVTIKTTIFVNYL